MNDLMCILHSSTHYCSDEKLSTFALVVLVYARVKNCHVLKQTRDAAINEQGQEREWRKRASSSCNIYLIHIAAILTTFLLCKKSIRGIINVGHSKIAPKRRKKFGHISTFLYQHDKEIRICIFINKRHLTNFGYIGIEASNHNTAFWVDTLWNKESKYHYDNKK